MQRYVLDYPLEGFFAANLLQSASGDSLLCYVLILPDQLQTT